MNKYIVTWAELNEEAMPVSHFCCGLLGVYDSKKEARDAIDNSIYQDVVSEIEWQKEDGEVAEELKKPIEDIMKDWTIVDDESTVEVKCYNGLRCTYSISLATIQKTK